MSPLYANLLSVDAKYMWNKIVHKQTASDPYTDVQSYSKKGTRGGDFFSSHLMTA
jgi:hypothetical protein